MGTIEDVTAVNEKNVAEFRRRLANRSDGALEIEARNTASAVGVAAAELLSERRETKAAIRHWSLMVVSVIAAAAAVVAAWPVLRPPVPQSAQPDRLPAASTSRTVPASAVDPRTPASSQSLPPRLPASQSQGTGK
jgi:hypothetical protein